jgi:N utilization substance protein B
MITRNKQQEYALYVIYSALVYRKANLEFAPIESVSDLTEIDYYENDIFLRELVIKSLINLDTIIKKLSEHLVKWDFNRLNMISQAILIMSYSHYYYVEKVDKAILINIAVKFAKKFVPDEDYKYINAILDKVIVNE